MSSKNKKNFLKQVNCFTIEKMSPEALEEAERVAKIIIDNKINILTQAHLKLIKKPQELNKKDLELVKEVSKVIKKLLRKKPYITEKYLKEQFDNLTKEVLNKALEDNNLMLVKGTVRNKDRYMVDDLDNVTLDDYIIVPKEKTELEKFIEYAGAEIKREIELNGYVLNRDLYSIACKNKKLYKEEHGSRVLLNKKEKETLLKNNIEK